MTKADAPDSVNIVGTPKTPYLEVGLFIVGGNGLQGLGVVYVFEEPVDIQSGLPGHLSQDFQLVDSLSLHVPCIEEGNVEFLELLGALLLGGFSGPQGQEPAAGERLILFPELPVGAFLGIHLLQWKVLPGDIQIVSVGFFHVSQPNCCNPYVGSKVVVENRQVNLLAHIAPPFKFKLGQF